MNHEAPQPDVWADDRVVSHSSPIEGSGLFATADIDEGTVVLRLGGRLVSSQALEELIANAASDPDGSYVDTITVYEDAHLVLPAGSLLHFGNHSCDPNLWHHGPYEFATRRFVAEGDELTLDYGASSGADGFVMDCRCGAVNCRGTITSEDWRIAELQIAYRGHWTPALQARIDQADAGRSGG